MSNQQDDRPPIHLNLDDEIQIDAWVEMERYVYRNRLWLTEEDIRQLRQRVHNTRSDAQHDRERRAELHEPHDPQDR